MRYANIYIYIFVLHRGFFQQPRPRVGIANLGLDAPSWQYMNRTYSGIADAATRPPQVNLRFWSSHTKNH